MNKMMALLDKIKELRVSWKFPYYIPEYGRPLHIWWDSAIWKFIKRRVRGY